MASVGAWGEEYLTMVTKYGALVWRANQVDTHGDIVTTKALEEMAERMCEGPPVSYNFDFKKQVGHVVDA